MGLLLWSGTLGRASFEERLAAAAACGYASLSVFPWDCRAPEECRSRAPELRARAREAGVALAALDPLSEWLTGWKPPAEAAGASAEQAGYARLFAAFGADECLEMAGELGCELVSAIEPYGTPVPVEPGALAFARLCDRAAGRGLRVQLEFMPMSGIPDLAAAWEIVRRAARPNGGLLLDTWHFARSASSRALLAQIPVDRIFSLQISDAPLEPASDAWHDTAHARRLPGEGELDLVGVLRSLGAARRGLPQGPEVCSDALSALAPREAARRAAASTQALLDAVDAGL
jgi:sugar phosphate isomerase/epimerase